MSLLWLILMVLGQTEGDLSISICKQTVSAPGEGKVTEVKIENEKDIVTSRSCGRKLAADLGFSAVEQARITAAISELARNIYKYAGSGTICIRSEEEEKRVGIYIIAKDNGPGIQNLQEAMLDGFTTGGGLGRGLPGVKRLMDNFDITSSETEGTRVEVAKYRIIHKRGLFRM
ncbi:ATP-binding protein [Terribacillus saccharophilus]|uniref:ATP-binding protein n=1 Tax=Terribacillus saccharophilus TaxID=361277 RepID=UPI003982D682